MTTANATAAAPLGALPAATLCTTTPAGDVLPIPAPGPDADPTYLVVLWGWSASCNSWLRQTNAVHVVDAMRGSQALLAEIPSLRICMTPCAMAVPPQG